MSAASGPPAAASGVAADESWRCQWESDTVIAILWATWPWRSGGKRSSATAQASFASGRAITPTRTPPGAASTVSAPGASG